MKVETLCRTVEKATERALRNLLNAHPDAIAPHMRQSTKKRIIGFLCDEMLNATGHRGGKPKIR